MKQPRTSLVVHLRLVARPPGDRVGSVVRVLKKRPFIHPLSIHRKSICTSSLKRLEPSPAVWTNVKLRTHAHTHIYIFCFENFSFSPVYVIHFSNMLFFVDLQDYFLEDAFIKKILCSTHKAAPTPTPHPTRPDASALRDVHLYLQ